MKVVIYSCPSDDVVATFGNGRIRPHLGESPPVNPLRKRHQGENHLSSQVWKSPPERSLSPSVTPGQRTGKRGIEKIEELNKENFIARNGRFH